MNINIALVTMIEIVPKGYKIEKRRGKDMVGRKCDRLINEETGGWFLLTSRSFKEINHSFSNLPSRAIAELKKIKRNDEPIKILDIGGGIEARSAGDIAGTYGGTQDERLHAYSLDIAAKKKNKSGLHQIIGNALELPIKDNSVDMAYSRMSVSLIEESDPAILHRALKETARVLKPGGLFFLDKTFSERTGRGPNLDIFKEFSEEFKAAFYSKEVGLFLGPLERIMNMINKRYPDWKFLIMIKEPVNERITKALKLKEKNRLVRVDD